jgi:YfiR/HmsC-like
MRMRAIRRRMTVVVLLVCLTGWHPVAANNSPRSPEYLIKAAYLYNFAMFVNWPSRAFDSPDSPIVVGIVGRDPFGWALDQTVENKRISKRRIAIERLQPHQDLTHCQILFIDQSEGARVADLAQRLHDLPILIVDDAVDGSRRGGAIDFIVNDNRVGFAINQDAARRAGLTISSKMLGLARAVR